MLSLVRGLTLLALMVPSASGRGAEFERPPTFDAMKVIGAAARGANYSVASAVRSDGTLRHYRIQTSFGAIGADGDQMALMRIRELKAIEALDLTTRSQKFADAVAKAGLAPFDFAGKLATNPVDAVGNTFSGIDQMLGGVISGVKHIGNSKESALGGLTGASRQKRVIALQYDVDPYTDFKPLADKLDALSGYAAAGGLLVTAAFAAIPGAVGAAISNVSSADSFNAMAVDYSIDQLEDASREKLAKLGVAAATANGLLSNAFYTPVDVASIADGLTRMGDVRGAEVVAAHAAAARSRDAAYFIRRSVELTAAYQERTHQITGFVQPEGAPYPLASDADGGLVLVFPFDCVAWTGGVARTFSGISARAGGAKVLAITGTATRLARKRLAALGWRVIENTPR